MLIQFQPQYLTILELELELLAIELRIVLVDNAMVVGTDDNNVSGVIVLRTGEVLNVMCLHNAVTILLANLFATNLVTIVVELLEHADDATVNLAVLHQQLLLNYRCSFVCHEEFIIITCLIDLFRNSVEGGGQLLIVGIGTTFHAQYIV